MTCSTIQASLALDLAAKAVAAMREAAMRETARAVAANDSGRVTRLTVVDRSASLLNPPLTISRVYE